MDEAAHRLRGRELPRLLGRWLVAGVLPMWVVLTALAYEWGAPADGSGGRLGEAVASSTSALLVVLLLVAPLFLLAPLLRRRPAPGLHPEDAALLAAEIAGAPVRVQVVRTGTVPVAPPRPRVPVQVAAEPVAPPASAPEPVAVEPAPPAPTRGDDDVDALFR